MKTYIKVDVAKQNEIMQDTYKYMPTFIMVDGNIARVIAQDGNTIYYI